MMYYRISKNEKILFFVKKNRPGVGSDLKYITVAAIRIYAQRDEDAAKRGGRNTRVSQK